MIGELGEEEESVNGVRELHHPYLLPPPPQHVGVPPLPLLQRVEATDHHHHRRKAVRQVGVVVCHVRGGVVPIGAFRQERPPHPVRATHGHHRHVPIQPDLSFRPLLAAKVRLHQDGASEVDGDGPRRGGGRRPALRHVVGDVGAGAVPGEEAAGEVHGDVDAVGETRGGEVSKHGDAVLVRGGPAVLGCEAVVDGHDDGAQLAAEPAAHGVVDVRGRREQREGAAVEVYHDWERGRGRLRRRPEHARPQAARRVHVGGPDALPVRARAGGGTKVEEVEDGAVDGAVATHRETGDDIEAEEQEPHLPRQGQSARRAWCCFPGACFHYCSGRRTTMSRSATMPCHHNKMESYPAGWSS
uniref:Uncharacterized protein n=1 Tax=Zea mays TaxID=4577 RepID=A0A804QEQ6_MAIZE